MRWGVRIVSLLMTRYFMRKILTGQSGVLRCFTSFRMIIPRRCPTPGDGEILAGFRPRTARSFCFGKRTQNQGRPGAALWGPLPRSRRLGLRNSLRSNSPRLHIRFGTGAQPRPQAPSCGAMGWRATNAPSSVAAPSHGAVRWPHERRGTKRAGRMRCGPYTIQRQRKDAGSSITNVEDCKGSVIR